MKISAQTKISELIRFNASSVEAIASIHPNLEKLRNPLLSKILASRVTIKDASRISGADISMFFNALHPLGFEVDSITETDDQENIMTGTKENYNSETENHLDVRPILAQGRDPFHHIMNALKTLEPGNELVLINSFEPTPLYKIIECKGYSHSTEKIDDTFYVRIRRIENDAFQATESTADSEDDFDKLLSRYQHNMIQVDVRQLEMPQPMITILSKLDAPGMSSALYVIHRKFPHLLIPELEERGYNMAAKDISENEIHLLIFRR